MTETGTLTDFEKSVADALCDAFEERVVANYTTTGLGQAFFRVWFKEKRGEALFFVFRQSLKVTNLQLGELIALISAYATVGNAGPSAQPLHFVSYDDFVSSVSTLIAALPRKRRRRDQAEWFARHYSHLLARTVVIDTFFGSCAVYVPHHLFVDLRVVCGLSGYVHSCGRNVFIRNVSKASRDHLFEAIERYLKRYAKTSDRILFTPYAHEDFPHDDEDSTSDLDHLKLHVEKFFVGREHLVDVLTRLQARFKKQLAIPEPGVVRKKRKVDLAVELRSGTLDETRTIWLLSDHHADAEGARTRDRYFICYEQMFHNRSPFFIFDENKPGWVEHTTMPHTLAAAMLNVTRPFWPEKDVVVADPFAGTGTTMFEAAKFEQVYVKTSDKSELACGAAADNMRFFSTSGEHLERLIESLQTLMTSVRDDEEKIPGTVVDAADVVRLSSARRIWEKGVGAQLDDAKKFFRRQRGLFSRIAFYLALRANKRHAAGLLRRSEAWPRAFSREASALIEQLERYRSLKEVVDGAGGTLDGTLAEYIGRYSKNVTISPAAVVRFLTDRASPQEIANAELIPEKWAKDSIDVVITDPPYGFNTDDDAETLARLYVRFLRGAVRALKDNGQLVICLPERSNIGKTPLGFQHHGIVTHQVFALARECGKEVVTGPFAIPGRLYRAPFYWESDRALRRSILHFRFRK